MPPHGILLTTARAGSDGVRRVTSAWKVAQANLEKAGEKDLAKDVRAFIDVLNGTPAKEISDRRR